jgi:hypothetical protein
MSEQLDDFVNQRLPLPGLLAWGAALPDGSFKNNGYSDGFHAAQLQSFLQRLERLSRKLSPCGTEGVRFCWTFQLVRVYTVCTAQGASLMLCMRGEPRFASEAMFNVLAEFEKLRWAETVPLANA